MNCEEDIPVKVYLHLEDSAGPEVRRFVICFPSLLGSYSFLLKKIKDTFSELNHRKFTVSWKDDEGEEVAISSDEELFLAMQATMIEKVKKFHVRIQRSPLPSSSPPLTTVPKRIENEPIHFGVFCDGCDQIVTGVRYKCAICEDYDLCSICREFDIHQEHPMYRIVNPWFDRPFGMGTSSGKPRSRRHSECGKKKRRFDKREFGPEMGDDLDEVQGMHNLYKKCKKSCKCPYTQVLSDLLEYYNPVLYNAGQSKQPQSQNPTKGAFGMEAHASNLKNLGLTLQKILDPLGISLEFEVRPKGEPKEGTKTHKNQRPQSAGPAPSAPAQKEVRFSMKEPVPESTLQKIDEISKLLSNQTLNSFAIDNGWVSFEDLKKESEESQAGTTKETPETPPASAGASEKKEEAAAGGENQSLYPNLTPKTPLSPAVKAALDNMMAMGFSNEGNWLSSLLEAKNGDINQALEAISFQRVVTK